MALRSLGLAILLVLTGGACKRDMTATCTISRFRDSFDDLWASKDLVIATGSNGAIARSTDRGRSWTYSTAVQGYYVAGVWGSDRALFVLATSATEEPAVALLRSVDRGINWEPLRLPLQIPPHTVTGTSDGEIFLAADPILHSLDDGATWSPLPYGIRTVAPTQKIVAAEDGTLLAHGLLTGHEGSGTSFTLVSRDRGSTWSPLFEKIPSGHAAPEPLGLLQDPPALVIRRETDAGTTIEYSTDRGVTWNQWLTLGGEKACSDLSTVAPRALESPLVGLSYGCPDGMQDAVRSRDDGATWEEIPCLQGEDQQEYYGLAFEGLTYYLGGYNKLTTVSFSP